MRTVPQALLSPVYPCAGYQLRRSAQRGPDPLVTLFLKS
jgi:hypothetical protein